ncbi:hypothetical protein C8F04DRAFT_1311574 [Mycena alexandri]|uniref:Uncharacterized protein n=1 Tax=Mycena alexandri TaxID=1745969 RepID=A0AAD6S6Q3_9AGAR|nr:hypothetical protein C8F04DRAFT_1311574 [Mycena alexandri]
MPSRAYARKISASISNDLAGSDDDMNDADAILVVDFYIYILDFIVLCVLCAPFRACAPHSAARVDDEEKEESDGKDAQEGSEDGSQDEEEEDFDGEEGSDEGSRSSDGEEEVVVVPKKRKRGSKNKIDSESESEVLPKKKHKKNVSSTAEESPAPREIEYNILLYTPAQMKLKKSSRAPGTEIFTLKSDETWPTLRTYCSITTISSRGVSDPIRPNDEDKYEYLIKKALLIVKNPNVKIVTIVTIVHATYAT